MKRFVLALALVVGLGTTLFATNNLDPYTNAKIGEGTCTTPHSHVQYYIEAVDNATGTVVAGPFHYGWTAVTHNGDGTVDVTLANIKATLGHPYNDVTVYGWRVDNCGKSESTVAILD